MRPGRRAAPVAAVPTSLRAAPAASSGSPVVDMIDVKDLMTSGCLIATVCAIMPPIEAPHTCAESRPSPRMRPTVSSAMWSRVYGASNG